MLLCCRLERLFVGFTFIFNSRRAREGGETRASGRIQTTKEWPDTAAPSRCRRVKKPSRANFVCASDYLLLILSFSSLLINIMFSSLRAWLFSRCCFFVVLKDFLSVLLLFLFRGERGGDQRVRRAGSRRQRSGQTLRRRRPAPTRRRRAKKPSRANFVCASGYLLFILIIN